LSRFVRATAFARGYDPAISPVSFAFNVLSKVRNSETESKTQWNIVYVNNSKLAYFRTSRNGEIKSVNLSKFDGSCKSPVKVFNMNTAVAGDVTGKFVDYNEKINFSITKQNDFLPQEFIPLIASYPSKGTSCQQHLPKILPNLRMVRR
jgi:penicillin V acylase-like amidase (Ntn superfamily)